MLKTITLNCESPSPAILVMMKRVIVSLVACCFSLVAAAQPIMKLDKIKLIMACRKIASLLLNDTIYCVVGTIFGVINAFVRYFTGDIIKAIFWMLCALVCIMNLKETPK